eukprot:46466_1
MSQVATAITDEGEDFNFDSWISQNSLSDIKNIFIKHNATSLSSLSLTSPALQSVMTDQQLLLKHSTKIPLIMIAIQKLTAASPRTMNTSSKSKSEYLSLFLPKIRTQYNETLNFEDTH